MIVPGKWQLRASSAGRFEAFYLLLMVFVRSDIAKELWSASQGQSSSRRNPHLIKERRARHSPGGGAVALLHPQFQP
jgi:hypothetical protein